MPRTLPGIDFGCTLAFSENLSLHKASRTRNRIDLGAIFDFAGAIYPRAEGEPGTPSYHHIDEGSPPRTNAAKAPGQWQTLDIIFQSPRFDDDGNKTANAKFVRVVPNGIVVQENKEVPYAHGPNWDRKQLPSGPVIFQGDYGPFALRNVRVEPARLSDDPRLCYDPEMEQKRTACNRDCPDACGIVATIDAGKVVRLTGDPEHPVTRGFLCHRTSRFLGRQYHPQRLTEPLVRRGSDFHAISWDEALDRIAERMLRIRDQSGAAAILHYRCGGSLGLMKHVADYFFERFGPVTVKSGDICSGAGDAAQIADFGREDCHDLWDVLNSRTIVLWGKNPSVSQVHLLPILKDAKRRGARLILIDPVYHRTARLCDQYVQPRPGGDIALALAVARVLFERNYHDPAAASYCDHLEAFRTLVLSRSLDQWAQLADVTIDQIEALGAAYADRPSAILVGWGMQRRSSGSATIRAIDALAAISGNLGVAGGGVSFCVARRGAFDLSFVGQRAAPRTIPEALLGPGILEADHPPIRMVWIAAANPVAMLPESRTVARALASRELTVVVDAFLTDTARCAHIVLPTTTMLEDDDLVGSYGHHWLAEVRPVVPPPAGVKTDYEILQLLARRVGLEDAPEGQIANGAFSWDVEAWKKRLLRTVADRGASLDALRAGAVRNPLAPRILFQDRVFATATGRVNLIQQVEPEPPPTTPDRPLLLMALSTPWSQASQWVEDAGGADRSGEPAAATVHPDSAARFRDGDLALLQSELGELTVRLRFDARQRRDVVLVPKGGHLMHDRCANALIPARQTDAGGGAAYYDTPVRIVSPRCSS